MQCVAPLNFYHKFLATTLLPAVLLALSAVVLGVFVLCDRRDFVSLSFSSSTCQSALTCAVCPRSAERRRHPPLAPRSVAALVRSHC